MPNPLSERTAPTLRILVVAATALIATNAACASQAITLEPVGFESLSGWRSDSQGEAFAAFLRSCRRIVRSNPGKSMGPGRGTAADWQPTCRKAIALGQSVSDDRARAFFERYFAPFAIRGPRNDRGLFTGYFEPELEGSLRAANGYNVPVYPAPKDLVKFKSSTRRHASASKLPRGRIVNGVGYPYFTRAEIDQGALAGNVEPLLYLKDKVDAFFLHVQGSGRVRLPNGATRRLGFAAKTGHPYTSIGAVLGKSGALPHGGISMQSIKKWLHDNPDQADQVLWANRSYIFFRSVDASDPALGPPGAEGVPLTPARSLAVDRKLHGYGTPLWVDATAPAPSAKGEVLFRRLMVAQDTGTAIVGAVRGDVFWGAGDRAGAIAGRMKGRGRMFALIPLSVAKRLVQR